MLRSMYYTASCLYLEALCPNSLEASVYTDQMSPVEGHRLWYADKPLLHPCPGLVLNRL
jgi:hypothetical protein